MLGSVGTGVIDSFASRTPGVRPPPYPRSSQDPAITDDITSSKPPNAVTLAEK